MTKKKLKFKYYYKYCMCILPHLAAKLDLNLVKWFPRLTSRFSNEFDQICIHCICQISAKLQSLKSKPAFLSLVLCKKKSWFVSDELAIECKFKLTKSKTDNTSSNHLRGPGHNNMVIGHMY